MQTHLTCYSFNILLVAIYTIVAIQCNLIHILFYMRWVVATYEETCSFYMSSPDQVHSSITFCDNVLYSSLLSTHLAMGTVSAQTEPNR